MSKVKNACIVDMSYRAMRARVGSLFLWLTIGIKLQAEPFIPTTELVILGMKQFREQGDR